MRSIIGFDRNSKKNSIRIVAKACVNSSGQNRKKSQPFHVRVEGHKMIRLHANGYFGLVQNGPDSVCAKRLRRAIIIELRAQGLSLEQVGEVFNLRKTRVGEIANSKYEQVEPLFGSGEWTPDVQDQDPRTCDRCGGDGGVVKKGSKLYCAACHRTGIDKRLQEQRVVTEIAEQYEELEADYQAAAERKPLAQRRKIKRA